MPNDPFKKLYTQRAPYHFKCHPGVWPVIVPHHQIHATVRSVNHKCPQCKIKQVSPLHNILRCEGSLYQASMHHCSMHHSPLKWYDETKTVCATTFKMESFIIILLYFTNNKPKIRLIHACILIFYDTRKLLFLPSCIWSCVSTFRGKFSIQIGRCFCHLWSFNTTSSTL